LPGKDRSRNGTIHGWIQEGQREKPKLRPLEAWDMVPLLAGAVFLGLLMTLMVVK
jgi:hypothetical protein